MQQNGSHSVTTLEALAALYDQPYGPAIVKEIDHVNAQYQKFIEAAPFFALATSGPDGLDCSPRGDAPGFVRVADPKTLLIPDRRGNNRIDSLRNIISDPRVALLFLIRSAKPFGSSAGRAFRPIRHLREASSSMTRRRGPSLSLRSSACSISAPRRSCARNCGTRRCMSTAGRCQARGRSSLRSATARSAARSTIARSRSVSRRRCTDPLSHHGVARIAAYGPIAAPPDRLR